jgi:hypothetical protein
MSEDEELIKGIRIENQANRVLYSYFKLERGVLVEFND